MENPEINDKITVLENKSNEISSSLTSLSKLIENLNADIQNKFCKLELEINDMKSNHDNIQNYINAIKKAKSFK